MVKAVIFDMDGVLADTESFYKNRRKKFLATKGISEDGFDFTGSNEKAIWEALVPEDSIRRYELMMEYRAYRKTRPAPFKELVFPEVKMLFESLKKRGIKIGIASSSDKGAIEALIKAAEIEPLLDCYISGEDCKAHKPNPEIYLSVMEKMAVNPDEAIAIEDSATGIASAKNAGMRVYALIPSDGTIMDQSAADARISNLMEVMNFL